MFLPAQCGPITAQFLDSNMFRSNTASTPDVNSVFMDKKQTMLALLLVVIGGLFLYANRDWFQRRPIQITHRLYRFASRFKNQGGPPPVMFEFDRKLKLTSIKIMALDDVLTNKYPHALWHMVSSSNSVPTKGFVYGLNVPGMSAASKGLAAESLEPGQKYRLVIEAGSVKGQHDFTIETAAR